MNTFEDIDGLPGSGRFLSALAVQGTLCAAARSTRMNQRKIFNWRKRNARFAAAVEDCRASTYASPEPPAALDAPRPASKRKAFLEALAETSSVALSAQRAGWPLTTIHRLRRTDARFAAEWRAALMEGYDMLEMELLGYLRAGDRRRRMDVASALRLLGAHRASVERERALREDDDEEAVLASIDRFIDEMRERREANAALLIEDQRAGNRDAGEDADGGASDRASEKDGGDDDAPR